MWRLLALVLVLALIATACTSGDDEGDADSDTVAGEDATGGDGGDATGDTDTVDTVQGGGTLEKVQSAGVLECGGNDTLPGFGIVDTDGNFSGFDIDFCKVVAAAVLGDAEAVSVTPLVAAQRFPTLQSGEIDVLIRNTTWTASRDGSEQATFLKTTFFDGQGFMVRADSGIASLDDVSNASICVLTGTTTLLNLNAVLGDLGIPFTPVEFESNDELNPAFQAGQCEVWTSDASQLASFAATMDIETSILPEIISKEPLGPVVADGDSQWAQIVDWATMATIQAWEWGIDSTNVDSFLTSEDSSILRFLGEPITDDEGNTAVADVGLGLDAKFAYNIISQVGNYQEIFERNLGPIGLSLDGSPNDLWTNGGLQYVPPFR
jgi:general L-amino acid transport system substrate-binding protein